jgi:hypothetical protein
VRIGGRQVQHLPDRATDRRDRRDGFVTGELDRVGVDRGDRRLDLGRRGIDEDGYDPGPPAGGRRGASHRRQVRGLGQGQSPRRARNQVQADGVGAGTERRQQSLGVGDAADLD